MKKPLLLCILALSLAACDLSNFGPAKKDNGTHHDVSLMIKCADGLNVKNHGTELLMSSYETIGIVPSISTIKRLDGKITFYMSPEFGQGQLKEEVSDDIDGISPYSEGRKLDFVSTTDQEIDFVYLTGISWTASKEDESHNKYLRVAIYDKETSSDYFVFSYDPNGTVTKTEYNLDLNMDGQLDKTQGYAWEDSELINYTTGMPSYMTDSYDIAVPRQLEIDNDKFDPLHACMKTDKPLAIRIWLEGWELENTMSIEIKDIQIELDFAPHFTK